MIGARYGISPFQVWREFSLRQIIAVGSLAARAHWRERAFQLALHGGDAGKEPEWNFGFNTDRRQRDMEELRAYIARKKAGSNGGQ